MLGVGLPIVNLTIVNLTRAIVNLTRAIVNLTIVNLTTGPLLI